MSVDFEYFRAADDDDARQTRESRSGPVNRWPGEPAPHGPNTHDGLSTQGIFPDPHLDILLAFAKDVPYERPSVPVSSLLWPPAETPPPLDDSSPWLTEPTVERLDARIRDGLCDIDPAQAPDLAVQWGPEVWVDDRDQLVLLITDLAALARRAKENGQDLYCWSSL